MNYYIEGDAAKADQIKAAFEELGYDISWSEGCANPDVINIGVERNGAKYVVAETSEYIKDIIKTHPDYKQLELPVEPKFKVGDDIKTGNTIETIAEVDLVTRNYCCESGRTIWFENQDLWHLAPKPHYDIANFKPFDKVLVRDDDNECWMPSLFGWFDSGLQDGKFVCETSNWHQCIPFEGNEHLLGTTDMPSEEYINW